MSLPGRFMTYCFAWVDDLGCCLFGVCCLVQLVKFICELFGGIDWYF